MPTLTSVCAGYRGNGRGYAGNFQSSADSAADHRASFTAGLTEEEQLEAAIRNSLNDRGGGGAAGAITGDLKRHH